ncbi:LuxR C-terminal-related transcriptional regulator [Microvirga soli]|uniref:LuxR C-terminal-related transcriptional regulator n=1 Tax=Microvirga soli TaxID=1854496 RepID=UPI0019201F52|nr:response regulator transcription factor [Microvirga soli]
METKIRVAVIDEYPLFREGVIYGLETHSDIDVVAQGTTAQDAFRIAREYEPHVIVIDLSILGSTLSSTGDTLVQFPVTSLLALTTTAGEEQVPSALRRGVRGFLTRATSAHELVQTVRALKRGEYYVAPSVAAKLLMQGDGSMAKVAPEPSPMFDLTVREEEILSILIKGCSNKEIGSRLALSEKTIKHHVTNILQKLQVRNRVEAALLAAGRMPAGAPLRQ